jgi:hypothetical protein
MFKGRQSMFHVAHVDPHLVHPGSDYAELFKDQIFQVIDHMSQYRTASLLDQSTDDCITTGL